MKSYEYLVYLNRQYSLQLQQQVSITNVASEERKLASSSIRRDKYKLAGGVQDEGKRNFLRELQRATAANSACFDNNEFSITYRLAAVLTLSNAKYC